MPPSPLSRFHARITDDPLREAFEGRRPLIPWMARQPIAPEEIPLRWEQICQTPRRGKSVAYLHVPFCTNHCLFCNFYRNSTKRHGTSDYVDALICELEREANTVMVQSAPVHAVYFGGGTPTDLEARDLARLLRVVRKTLPLSGDCEITIEARATGFTPDKIKACLDAGANRFSFGVQTFDSAVRKRLGRRMSGSEIAGALASLCSMDRAAIVCDLIFGLPGQTDESWQNDLNLCLELGLDGVDLYCLTLIPTSPLARAIEKGSIQPGAAIREQASRYAIGVDALMAAGWRQLSTAHFARDTRERNLYNQLIKAGAPCLAYGSGAAGNSGGHHYLVAPDLSRYLEESAEKKPLAGLFDQGTGHTAKGQITEGMESGRLDLSAIDTSHHPDWMTSALPLLAQWESAKLLRRIGSVITLTLAGRFWHTNLAAALHQLIDGAPDPGQRKPAFV